MITFIHNRKFQGNTLSTYYRLFVLIFVCRELKEECGLSSSELRKIGFLEFEFEGDPTLLEVHVFETYKYHGEVTESEGKNTS